MRSDAKKRIRNQDTKSLLKTLQKQLVGLVKSNSKDVKPKAESIVSQLDKAAKRGIITKNTANRKKARLARLISKKTSK